MAKGESIVEEEVIPSDINDPKHFATRDMDRSEKGMLMRLFDELDQAARQELIQAALRLVRKRRDNPPETKAG